MKNLIITLLAVTAFTFSSCTKDEGILPKIELKTGGSYTSSDVTLPKSTNFTVGIHAEKTEKKDVLKKFNVSRSINGDSPQSVLTVDVTADEEDEFNYDFTTKTDTISGQVNKYTFVITNRDGLTNRVELTVTVQ
jgi:hypothetical protein